MTRQDEIRIHRIRRSRTDRIDRLALALPPEDVAKDGAAIVAKVDAEIERLIAEIKAGV